MAEFITSTGTSVFYEERGQGTPLVLVHGSLCDYRYWRWQIEALSASHRVIVPSLDGFWPHLELSRFSIPQQTESLAELIAHRVGAEQPYHLLGHSRGAQVALALAQHQASAPPLASLTLADPAFATPTAPATSGFILEAAQRLEREGSEAALCYFIDSVNGAGTWQRMVSWFKQMVTDNAVTLAAQAKEHIEPLDVATFGQHLACPLLLIAGQRSPERYHEHIALLKAQLPDAYQVTIAKAAHGMNLANPKAFNQSMLRFLAAVDHGRARPARRIDAATA